MELLGEIAKLAPRHAQSGDSQESSPVSPELQTLDLGNPAAYVKFCEGVLNFALVPDAARPGQAAHRNCSAPLGSWLWIESQVGNQLSDPETDLSARDSSIGASSTALRRIARRRRPLFVSPPTMGELYESWTLLCGRRVDTVRAQLQQTERIDSTPGCRRAGRERRTPSLNCALGLRKLVNRQSWLGAGMFLLV